MYPFHEEVQKYFPDFDYKNPQGDRNIICNMKAGPDNKVGHQQRAFSVWWALKKCTPLCLGLDLGSPKGLTPYCIHVDVFGDGREHPFYGGRCLADVCRDASDVSMFPENAWPYIASNHSLEHMTPVGDNGIIDLLVRWIALLRSDGVLAMIIPDNDHFNVLASDRDHKHAWGHSDFRQRVLSEVVRRTGVELVDYDTLQNNFSFDVVLRKP